MQSTSYTTTFVSCLYWWSLIITSATPLCRYIVANEWVVVTLGGLYPAYRGVAEEPTKDRAFGLHSLFSLLWITMAYIQICWIDSTKRNSMHKIFGYLTVVALVLHSLGALSILYEDVEDHTLLNKLMLFGSLVYTVSTVFRAIKKAVNGNYNEHRVLMVRAFVSSLDGAGTIRTVGHIQMVLGCGPIFCQSEYGKVGGHCDWTYTSRLAWTSVLRAVQLAVYCKLEEKTQPHLLKEMWEDLKRNYIPGWILLIGCFVAGLDHGQTLIVMILLKAAITAQKPVEFAVNMMNQLVTAVIEESTKRLRLLSRIV